LGWLLELPSPVELLVGDGVDGGIPPS
jgi:hypothetical protein